MNTKRSSENRDRVDRFSNRLTRWIPRSLALAALGLWVGHSVESAAQAPAGVTPKKGLELSLWAREPMVQDPVALSFDDQGRLYVAETARRGTVDIDIRAHPDWLVEDLSSQSIADMRRFFRSRMAPGRSNENARWLKDYNGDGSHDWRDLEAVKERVRLLEDPLGLGKATRSTVFKEGFNEEVNGVLAGVMPWEGDVFATVYPDLWRLRDPQGRGVASSAESLFRGFGVHAAFDGHDLHGLTMGPDGKVYFSIGDNGFSVTTKEGRQLHHPNTGGVLRMNPDGSDLEVFATGLRNVQEIAFDEFGNMFGVDNDGDLADERERFVYIVEGSDSGWRLHWQFKEAGWARYTKQPNYNPWVQERMWVPWHPGQPAHITPPLSNYSVGPSGFKYNPGTALNDAYRRHFFLVQFPVQKVTAFQARPKGAGFEMVGEHVVLSGMMASSVNFAPDGGLYVADWDGMWNPDGKGAIWRLDDPAARGSAIRTEVRELLRQGMRERGVKELADLLGHADMRIRQRAQFELVRRHELQLMLSIAVDRSAPRLARVHALWGIGQLRERVRAEAIPLRDADPEIRAQAAKLVGDLRLTAAADSLVQMLGDARPRVRFHAAMALGKVGSASVIPAVTRMLSQNEPMDAFLRQAGICALAGIGQPAALQALTNHPSALARTAAVVALRRLGAPEVAAFLEDADKNVRAEAIRAIHDDTSIMAALPKVAALLDSRRDETNEAVSRRAVSASLRLGRPEDAARLIQVALDGTRPGAVRADALEALAAWDQTPALDRVEGQVRRLHPKDAASATLGRKAIQANAEALLQGATPAVAEALARVLADKAAEIRADLLLGLVRDEQRSPETRAKLLPVLASTHPKEGVAAVDEALNSAASELRIAALRTLSERDPTRFITLLYDRYHRMEIAEQQQLLQIAAQKGGPVMDEFLRKQTEALERGTLRNELILDVKQAGSSRRLFTAEHGKPSAGAVSDGMTEALYGGDARRGETLFRTHVSAQCVRCHDAGGVGKQAGPVLQGIGARATREYILESLLEPSAKLAPGFETLTLTLTDNDTVDGQKVSETADQITLRTSEGEVRSIPRRKIQSTQTSTVSNMPSMRDALTPFEIRDLVEFLSQWR